VAMVLEAPTFPPADLVRAASCRLWVKSGSWACTSRVACCRAWRTLDIKTSSRWLALPAQVPPPPPPRLPFLYSFPLHMHAPDVPPHVVRSSFDPGLYRRRQGALGASGAVSAITMFSVCVNPRATFMLWMVLPVPAIVFGVGYVAYDLWGAYTGTSNTGVLLLGLCVLVGLCSHARWWQCCVSGQHGTAHAGHLGGALAGVAYYLLIRKRLIRRW